MDLMYNLQVMYFTNFNPIFFKFTIQFQYLPLLLIKKCKFLQLWNNTVCLNSFYMNFHIFHFPFL